MIIRVTAPAGGLQYPAQKEANANVQSVHTADPNLYNNVENPAVLWK